MTTVKAVNYTPEQTAEMVKQYAEGFTPEAIAASMGKSVRSIVAKLSREGVYVPKAKEATTKAASVGKADMAAAIAKAANMTDAEATDMQKLTKQTLVNLLAFAEKSGDEVVCYVDIDVTDSEGSNATTS